MGKTLTEIAEQLRDSKKKVQLIYAFNGTGKTRLSLEFKDLVAGDDQPTRQKIIYYNSFTEDLFFWDNDLVYNRTIKLKIQNNSFTDWIFREQGKEIEVIRNFYSYTSNKIKPQFNKDFSEIVFSAGNDESMEGIKISRGEESNFIWSIFYTLIKQIVDELNEEEENRSTEQFNALEYIFIDDPVSSLDENNLIQQAVDLAAIIKSSKSKPGIKFIITTHNVLFYNVLYNELSLKDKGGSYLLSKNEDGSFEFLEKRGDSNKSFSYHLHLKGIIEIAIENQQVERFHFMLLRNLYEKTSNFLGYGTWSEILPKDDRQTYYQRIINFTSHTTLSNEEYPEPTSQEKEMVRLLLSHLIENYNFCKNR